MRNSRQAGFTLLELVVTVVIAGVLLGVAIPSFREFQRNSRIAAVANDTLAGVLAARAEAVKRQVPVTFCLSADPNAAAPTCSPGPAADASNLGFFVWVDESGPPDENGTPDLSDATDGNAKFDAGEQVLMRVPPPGGTVQVSANCGHVSYGPNGYPRAVTGLCAPAMRSILFCDDRGARATSGTISSARVVTIDAPGRGQVLQEVADVTDQIADELSAVKPTCP